MTCPNCGKDAGKYFNQEKKWCSQVCSLAYRSKISHLLRRYRKTYCQRCNAKEKLQTHHLDHNPANNNPTNFITLCLSCHQEIHSEQSIKIEGLDQIRLQQEIMDVLWNKQLPLQDLLTIKELIINQKNNEIVSTTQMLAQ